MRAGRIALASAAGLLLAGSWGLVCPWLTELAPVAAARLRPALALVGLLIGMVACLERKRPLILGARVVLGAVAAAAVGVALLERELGSARALALGFAAVGSGALVAIATTLLARRLRPMLGVETDLPSSIRPLVAIACGALVVSAWALAAGYVLGRRDTARAVSALGEAEELSSIAAVGLRGGGQVNRLVSILAPPGGYLIVLDGDRVVAGAGSGVRPGMLLYRLGPTANACLVSGRPMPCASRPLDDHTRVVAAVPIRPIASGVVLIFLLAGLAAALGALVIGGLIGGATARDLDWVTATISALGRGHRGLESPIVALSLDEVGALAVALGRLRARLAPELASHQATMERAQAADRARTEFLELAYTELRIPLDQLVQSARTLLDPESQPLAPEQREDVRIILSSATHLIDLIDEVLDLSTIASGEISLRLSDVDIGQLVTDIARAQRPLVQKKGIAVELEVATPSPHVHGDERRLRQVVTNIVANAVKFTESGLVSIAVSATHDEVTVSVRDTGPGIAADALPRLFSEFVQLGALKQRARGTGLGLAICKRLVEAHDGTVAAESRLGEGSIFRVILPAKGPATSASTPAAEARG